MGFEKELNTAVLAVERACRLCKDVANSRSGVTAMEKQDHSPVTIADLASQAAITMTLLNEFGSDFVVGEEEAGMLRENKELSRKVLDLVRRRMPEVNEKTMLDAIDYGARKADYSGRFWTVDPIDGTKGFLRKDQYAIALALLEEGRVVMGILGCPNLLLEQHNDPGTGSVFHAVTGHGSRVRFLHEPLSESRPIHVDNVGDVTDARFCESVESAHASHQKHGQIARALGITAAPCRMDSQVKYAALAKGDASIYLRLPRKSDYREKIWDHAAGMIIVEEAGGRVSDFKGKPLQFNLGRKLENNIGVLATNGTLHDKVLDAIADVV